MAGIELIAAERRRQIAEESWTPEHDDEHQACELAMAAVCYATPDLLFVKHERANSTIYSDPWPWEGKWDKRGKYGDCRDGGKHEGANFSPNPGSYNEAERKDLLVKAGALIAAEIDRLERVEP